MTNNVLFDRRLTLKCTFLLALSSGRRRSELHALSRDILFSSGSARLHCVDGFISKTQKPGDSPLSWTISSNASNSHLCAVACLKDFCAISDSLLPDRQLLFISIQKPHREVKVDSISRWICTLIRESYCNLCPSVKPHVNAHEVRAISSSLFVKDHTIDDILSTGLWRSKFSFLNHYQRDIVWDVSEYHLNILNKHIT